MKDETTIPSVGSKSGGMASRPAARGARTRRGQAKLKAAEGFIEQTMGKEAAARIFNDPVAVMTAAMNYSFAMASEVADGLQFKAALLDQAATYAAMVAPYVRPRLASVDMRHTGQIDVSLLSDEELAKYLEEPGDDQA